jgi:thymidylate kinase
MINVAVGGPQGVGKSSAVRVLALLRPELRVVFFGDQLPDDFRSRSPQEKAALRARVAEQVLSRLASGGPATVVDLHYIDPREADPKIQRMGFLSHFDLLVFLTVPPEVLRERRAADRRRTDRSLIAAELGQDVRAHLDYFGELVAAGFEAVLVDCQGPPAEIARKLLDRIDTIRGRDM